MPTKDPEKRKAILRRYYRRHKRKILESRKNSPTFREVQRKANASWKRRLTKESPRHFLDIQKRYRDSNKLKLSVKRLEDTYKCSYGHLCKLHAVQGMACGICGTPIPPPPSRKAHVDHCHDTGKVRGILCRGCNLSLGHYERFQKLGMDRVNNYLSKGT
jgi:hypothetical protein